jgi:Leucine-rich repeat (LRR) protein
MEEEESTEQTILSAVASNQTELDLKGGFIRTLHHVPIELASFGDTLVKLDLSCNCLIDLPESAMKSLTNLKELLLYSNQLTSIPDYFGEVYPLLEVLDIGKNRLVSIPPSLANCTELRVVSFAKNQLSEFNFKVFAPAWSNLRSLNLSVNQIKRVPDEVGQFVSLTSLDLSMNQLKKLPEAIGGLEPTLKKLSIQHNSLTVLPNSIGQLHALTVLDLRCNHLLSLGMELGNLEDSLEVLLIDGNPLALSVPHELSSLSTKQILHHLYSKCCLFILLSTNI